MVDNATLKNPTGNSSRTPETTTDLAGESRTWTIRDTPQEGTYTLQAIVEAREREKNAEIARLNPEQIANAATVYQPQENQVDLNDTNESPEQTIDLDNTTDDVEGSEAEEEEVAMRQQARKKQAVLRKASAQQAEEVKTLNVGWFMIALIMALLFDILGFLINFIPIVGQLVTSLIITPLGLTLLWLMHIFGGAKFDFKAQSRLAITGIIEFIPIVQVLPALTVYVLLSKFAPTIEKYTLQATKNIAGSQVGDFVQKQIDR